MAIRYEISEKNRSDAEKLNFSPIHANFGVFDLGTFLNSSGFLHV